MYPHVAVRSNVRILVVLSGLVLGDAGEPVEFGDRPINTRIGAVMIAARAFVSA